MSKLITINNLQDYLDEDIGWRQKEISNLKSIIKSEKDKSNTIVRATIPILYAHWEGFIKNASVAYVDYVNNQNKKYNELDICFVVFGIKKRINELIESKQSNLSIETIKFIIEEMDNPARLMIKNSINTESNLNSKIFENIVTSIGLDPNYYKTYYNLIDESLLKRRNNIAHGKYLDIGDDESLSLADEIVKLIRQFKTDIEDAASQAKFIRKI